MMTVIFLFSSQGSDTTYKTSGKLVTPITNQIKKSSNKSFDNKKKEKSYWKDVKLTVEQYIRKGAHIFLFTLLSLFIYLTLTTYSLPVYKIYLLTLTGCFIYGGLDELHQHFVKGRNSTLTDVFIDSIGALIIIAFFLIKGKISYKENKGV